MLSPTFHPSLSKGEGAGGGDVILFNAFAIVSMLTFLYFISNDFRRERIKKMTGWQAVFPFR